MSEQIARFPLPMPAPAAGRGATVAPLPPDAAEARALRQAGDYLMRAGTAAARALFAADTGGRPAPEADALAVLSDELLAAARVCAGLLAPASTVSTPAAGPVVAPAPPPVDERGVLPLA